MKPWRGQSRFLERLFSLEAFIKFDKSHLAAYNNTLGQPERLAAQVDALAALIRPAVADESDVKPTAFHRRIAANPTAEPLPPPLAQMGPPPGPARPGGPGGPGGMPVKLFVPARVQSVAGQLAGKQTPATPPQGARGGPIFFAGAALHRSLDADQDGALSRTEMLSAFSRFFADWAGTPESPLTADQLRAGLENLLPPLPGPGMMIMGTLP